MTSAESPLTFFASSNPTILRSASLQNLKERYLTVKRSCCTCTVLHKNFGTLEGIRTPNLHIRSVLLCPVELREYNFGTSQGFRTLPASFTVKNASIYTCAGIVLVVVVGFDPTTSELSALCSPD